jgi:hypothetical protein
MGNYAELDDNGFVFAVTQSQDAPVGNFVECESLDVFGWKIEDGVLTPPEPITHKTSGIAKSDWRRLFNPNEILRFRYLVKNIDGDLSELSGHSALSSPCGLPGIEALTWLQVLQIMVDEWSDATVINATDPRTIASTTALGVVGVLDDISRVDVLLEGVPL